MLHDCITQSYKSFIFKDDNMCALNCGNPQNIISQAEQPLWACHHGISFVKYWYCSLLFNRKVLGGFYLLTMAFFPALLASFAAINIERKERQPILALYMFNNVSP